MGGPRVKIAQQSEIEHKSGAYLPVSSQFIRCPFNVTELAAVEKCRDQYICTRFGCELSSWKACQVVVVCSSFSVHRVSFFQGEYESVGWILPPLIVSGPDGSNIPWGARGYLQRKVIIPSCLFLSGQSAPQRVDRIAYQMNERPEDVTESNRS